MIYHIETFFLLIYECTAMFININQLRQLLYFARIILHFKYIQHYTALHIYQWQVMKTIDALPLATSCASIVRLYFPPNLPITILIKAVKPFFFLGHTFHNINRTMHLIVGPFNLF